MTAGFEAWLVSSNMEAVKRIGLKASRKIKIFNGGHEGRFLGYELYEGTRKYSKMSDDEKEAVLKEEIDVKISKPVEKLKPIKKVVAPKKKSKPEEDKSSKIIEDFEDELEDDFGGDNNIEWMDDDEMNFGDDSFV